MKFFQSRTIWALIVLVLFISIPDLQQQMPGWLYKLLMDLLIALAAYFKMSPSQTYGTGTTLQSTSTPTEDSETLQSPINPDNP